MNKQIEAVIFDWAGTTVDFGCFAPVQVFVQIFEQAGVPVTIEEARKPMGMLKIDHIRTMLEMPRISAAFEEVHGRPFTEEDVQTLYGQFEEALMKTLAKYTDPIAGVCETVQTLREQGIKIGSTTGYTREMMEVVTREAKKKGYASDFLATADDTNQFGRPYPYMLFRNIEALQIQSTKSVVKVGDTTSDMQEAKNAGVLAIGVIVGSSEMGYTEAEYAALPEDEKHKLIEATRKKFEASGADYTIETMPDLLPLLEQITQPVMM